MRHEDAAEAFNEALSLDRNYTPAMMELGWLYLSVFDDPQKAKQYFDRVIEIVSQDIREAFRGAAQCAEEIGGVEARADVVKRASSLLNLSDINDSADNGS